MGSEGLTVLEYHKLEGFQALGGAGTACSSPGKLKQPHLGLLFIGSEDD